MKFPAHFVPQSACPACGRVLDAATNADGSTIEPRIGDISICIECAHVLVFDEHLALAWPTQEQRESWSVETLREISFAQRAILRARAPEPQE